jgi:hypothetical protein
MSKHPIVPGSFRALGRLQMLLGLGVAFALTSSLAVAADRSSCATNAATRTFDFWLGDWVVSYQGAAGNSASTVALSLDQCLFVETWGDGKGHNGESAFAYSPDDRTWHGLFADNRGRAHVFVEGKVTDGEAEFLGPSRGEKGESILTRMKVSRVSADKLKQTWEKSADSGKTWTVEFALDYTRRAP